MFRTGLALFLAFLVASASADTFQLKTDPTWRAIGPAGDQHGKPIVTQGLVWEGANAGWNTSLTYDHSDAAGWVNAVYNGQYGVGDAAIWVNETGLYGLTPAYFRKIFTLDGIPTQALLDVTRDDDIQLYINGQLALNDTDGGDNTTLDINVTSFLVPGQNLIAAKAHDSYGAYEQFSAVLDVTFTPVPEPSTIVTALAGLLVVGWLAARRITGRR
jgi:hypothetical protein